MVELVALSETLQPGAGGARPGGRRGACTGRALSARCARIALITAGSSMHAMMRVAPPQPAQVSTSMPNTRFRRCAQRIASWRSVGGRTSALAASAPPGPADQRAVRTVEREHTMEAGEVHLRPGHQRGQARLHLSRSLAMAGRVI